MPKRDFRIRVKTRCVSAACAMLMVFVSAPVLAASDPLRLDPGMAGLADMGTVQCDYLVELLPIGPKGFRQSLMTYAQGFIYAKSGKPMDDILAGQERSWNYTSLSDEMVQYCRANPDRRIPDAAAHLWSVLVP